MNSKSSKNVDEEEVDLRFIMPLPPTKSQMHKGHRNKGSDPAGQEKRKKGQQKSTFRKAYRGNRTEENRDTGEDKRKHEEKLLQELSECIVECSRQRLRALHMSFRQYGNDDSKMTTKEMNQALQDNGVVIPSLVLKSLTAKFDSNKGIDLESMYKFIVEAHRRTGRDSVLAMYKRNDLEPRLEVSQDEIDEDLLWRIESLLIKTHSYIDIQNLRNQLQMHDNSRMGKMDPVVLKNVCNEQQMPVFGALLKNLIKRCTDEKKDKIRWPEFLSFLERAQEQAWKTCPGLAELPDKMKNKTIVAPSLLDELSSKTRNTIVNRLRKKSSIKKPNPDELDKDPKMDENQNTKKDGDISVTRDSDRTTVTENHINATNTKPVDKTPNINATNTKPVTANSKTGDKTPNGKENTKDGEKKKRTKDLGSQKSLIDSPSNKDNGKIQTVSSRTSTPSKSDPGKSKTSDASTIDTELGEDKTDSAEKDKDQMEIDIRVEGATPNDSPAPSNPNEEPNKSDKGTEDDEEKLDVENLIDFDTNDEIDAKENVEMVTIKDGQIMSVKTEDQVLTQKQADQDENDKDTFDYSIQVKGKTLNYTVDSEDYLDRQMLDPPTERLKLTWVYGYRGNDCRKNIHILANGDTVYFISFVVVIYNRNTHVQRHYKEHTDEVKCIDIHPNGVMVATGQYANRKNPNIKAHIRIWRSDTLQTLQIIGAGKFEKSVACVAFSPNKDLLAAVDNCIEKAITIWDISNGELKGEEKLNTDLVCDIGFNPKFPDTVVTMGKEHICWWKVYTDSSTVQVYARPDFEGFLRAKFVICLTFTEKGDLITGDSNGTIYVFGEAGNKITNFIKHAHDGPVFTIVYHRGHILSGGRDGIIHSWQWGKNMDSTGFIQIPKSEGGIRMLKVVEGKLLVGTTMNSILVVNISEQEFPLQGAYIETVPLTQCHYDDLRGLTIVRNSHVDVLTAGLDGVICSYNSRERKAGFKFQMKGSQYLSIDTNSSGTLLALGTKDGYLQILEKKEGSWVEVVNRKLCKDRFDVVRLSPDCQHVALGCHDTCIYVYSFLPREDKTLVWEFVGKLKGHKDPIKNLDWSAGKGEEGYILRSTSLEFELRYWLPATLEVFVKQNIISKTKWSSDSVFVDPAISGILATKHVGDTDVVSVNINYDKTLVAMGDNSGSLNLFRYPCSLTGVFCHTYKSHATVYDVRFTFVGNSIMTIGGRDSCLMQWEVV